MSKKQGLAKTALLLRETWQLLEETEKRLPDETCTDETCSHTICFYCGVKQTHRADGYCSDKCRDDGEATKRLYDEPICSTCHRYKSYCNCRYLMPRQEPPYQIVGPYELLSKRPCF